MLFVEHHLEIARTMNTARRALMTGLMAAALLATALGGAAQVASAKPIDEAYALQCRSISHRVAQIAYRFNHASELGLSGIEVDALVAEYRDLLRQWQANGCDASFGTLPRLAPRSKIDAVNQAVSTDGQVLAPANQP